MRADTWGDSPKPEGLLDRLDLGVEFGRTALDKRDQACRNARLIEVGGGLPLIDQKANVTPALAFGHPAWKQIALRPRKDRRAFWCRCRQWTLVEEVFGAVKRRFGDVVQARRRRPRRVEFLCRVVAWSALGLVCDRL